MCIEPTLPAASFGRAPLCTTHRTIFQAAMSQTSVISRVRPFTPASHAAQRSRSLVTCSAVQQPEQQVARRSLLAGLALIVASVPSQQSSGEAGWELPRLDGAAAGLSAAVALSPPPARLCSPCFTHTAACQPPDLQRSRLCPAGMARAVPSGRAPWVNRAPSAGARSCCERRRCAARGA